MNCFSERIYWTCSTKDCHGSVMTDVHCLAGETRINHNHPPNYVEIERMKVFLNDNY